jgi:hypothetical protein
MTCAYAHCQCQAEAGLELDGREFCSAYCVGAEMEPEEGCGCGHLGCATDEPGTGTWANHP